MYKRAIKLGQKREEEAKETKTSWQRVCEVMTGTVHSGFDIWWLFPTNVPNELRMEYEYW